MSVAVPSTFCSAPSVLTLCGAVQLATPESPGWSSHVKVTVTSELFHPFAFAAGSRTCEIVGALLSICTVTVLASSLFPALSTE